MTIDEPTELFDH